MIYFDLVDFLIEFCLNEISLEGLEGCKLSNLFDLFYKCSKKLIDFQTDRSELSQDNKLTRINEIFSTCLKQDQEGKQLKNYLLKLILNQSDINVYKCTNQLAINKASNNSNKSFNKSLSNAKNIKTQLTGIVNDSESNQRGFCLNYAQRVLVKNKQEINLEDLSLILCSTQQQRNKCLCPFYKELELECLNDLEYCVLESIGKSRYDGISSIGDNGLSQLFNLAPKQLHYILAILESHQLIKKQVLTSEKKKSIIHLSKFSFKKKSILENLCDYLVRKHERSLLSLKDKKKQKDHFGYFDSSVNLKRVLNQSNKQFKTLIQTGEKQNILKRYFMDVEAKFKKNKSSSKFYTATRQIRMIKLTDSYIKSIKDNKIDYEEDGEEEDGEDDETSLLEDNLDKIGSAQSTTLSLYTQIFNQIEQCGKNGISLKQLGNLFGFDFYKSRRMGSNLQTHPEIVTMIKETNRGKAKYQTIFMRKFLNSNSAEAPPLSQEPVQTQQQEEVTVLANKNIQALLSNRTLLRKKLIQDYIDKNKICTKYELSREIRNYELSLGLKGSIDSKTTKRMLLQMEKENKLKIFDVKLKNSSYMCAKSIDLKETDEIYINYCNTFKRTFDSVDLKIKNESSNTSLVLNESSNLDSNLNTSDLNLDSSQNNKTSFTLTRSFINSVVEKLNFSTSFSKTYALVPKFQKAIILHRFLHYILFFYNGLQQSIEPNDIAEIKSEHLNETDTKILESCELPKQDKLYQPVVTSDNSLPWNSFIPPLNRNENEKNCVFIGEIFSHMPLSVFSSIIVINHQVPGLVAILKHPQKRHLLVKDLPPSIIAPLIFERRYLQRILAILQLLACLGLVSFVESPFKNNQSLNRDIQSQMIYVHRKALFYDTSSNKCQDWSQLKEYNNTEFENYEKCLYEFNCPNDLVEYWRKLLHISMNTYKFSVGKYLHESKRLRQELLNKIVQKYKIEEIEDLWAINKYGDNMGPGMYDSQLFLNSFKNWMINQSNLNPNESSIKKTRSKSRLEGNSSSSSSSSGEPAITKQDDQSFAPYSELALFFPFGVFRGIASSTSLNSNETQKKAQKRKLDEKEFKFRKLKKLKNPNYTNINLIKTAKHLIDKAKMNIKLNNSSKLNQMNAGTTQSLNYTDRRANWSRAEDELILLIKVTSLFFLPKEKSVPFKLINDIMNILVPKSCLDKRVSSFGRRIKILMKSKMNVLFVSNKLELIKQDKDLEKKYSSERCKIRRNLVDKELIDLYVKFINDVKEKYFNKKRTDDFVSSSRTEQELELDLPDSLQEFNKKYKILNSAQDLLFKTQSCFYTQPRSDYEITSNTLHSAIHSSILINDKNPRVFESFNLFDKYSDQLLTDVISKMSSQHKIIAPTKYSELKKKNVTAFSKHIGKAYHISQRYQYKWLNNITQSVLNDTNTFKDDLVNFKLENTNQEEMFDCTDRDDLGMTSFLAHTIDNSDLQVQIDVPNKIWVSKLI